jgi:hypothetical protein
MKKWHKRLGQAFRERAQTIAESGPEDESILHGPWFDGRGGGSQENNPAEGGQMASRE